MPFGHPAVAKTGRLLARLLTVKNGLHRAGVVRVHLIDC